MKILLIYPYCLEDRLHAEDVQVVPQGVYYVAAILKEKGYDVEILNWHHIKHTPQRIKEIITEKKPFVIGFSILHANRWGGIEIARIAKKIYPNVNIIFGGIGATYLWEHFLTHFPEIDYVVLGEGEYSFSNLVDELKNKKIEKIQKIKGIAFRKNNRPVKTERDTFIRNLDSIPNPAKYYKYQHLSLTRGCAGDCTFCGSPQFWKKRIRFHSADYFVEELVHLNRKGVNFFYFSDDTFTINENRTIEVCKKIQEEGLNITYVAISRVDQVNEEVLYWMRKSGCIQISYGVESGDEKIREYLNKGITQNQIKHAFKTTVKYGILARAYFIYGCAGETRETISETIKLIHQINPLSAIFYILDLYPGTALYEEYKNKANISDDIWLNRVEDIMYFETDPKLNSVLIQEFGSKLRTSFHKNLSDAVDRIDLIDRRELYPLHADFLSRLAMTFHYGDYANIEVIKNNTVIAEKLYEKALSYQPDARAYLGLGIIQQKSYKFRESINILKEGIDYFPENEQLNTCLGINYMNMGEFEKALGFLLPFKQSKQTHRFIAECYQALNDSEKSSEYSK